MSRNLDPFLALFGDLVKNSDLCHFGDSGGDQWGLEGVYGENNRCFRVKTPIILLKYPTLRKGYSPKLSKCHKIIDNHENYRFIDHRNIAL